MPGMPIPRLVCVSFATYDNQPGQVARWLRDRVSGCLEVLKYLQDPDVILVGFNTAYDLACVIAEASDLHRVSPLLQPLDNPDLLALVFSAYENDRVSDTMVRAMLWDIARGTFQIGGSEQRRRSYTLQRMASDWLGIELAKEDTWRLHYAWLADKPLSSWPPEAVDYAELDADITAQLDACLIAKALEQGAPDGVIPDEWRQVRAAWVFHLVSAWGVRVDGGMVSTIKSNLLALQADGHKILTQWGVLRADGTKDMKRFQELIASGYAAQGRKAPTTPKGAIKTGADEARESGHPAGIAHADIANVEKLLSTYIPVLEQGMYGTPICGRINTLVASGRTSAEKPNWQNLPRKGQIRDCVVPRAGNVLVSADLDTVELRALAQTCLEIVGYSEMAAALQRGEDLHLSLAADILGLTYQDAEARYKAGDPVVEHERQEAKKPNFGFPGGMGARRYTEQYNAELEPGQEPMTVEKAYASREAWFKRWPEMREYLQHAGLVCDSISGSFTIQQPWSGRIRGGLDYCSCANTYFQGRVADGAKLALWRIARACYVDTTSPLYGCRIVLFIHDEVILEIPEGNLDEASRELVRLLCEAVQEVIPDVPITSQAVAMRRWYKGAKPVKVAGKLVPGKPKKDSNGKTTWIPDL